LAGSIGPMKKLLVLVILVAVAGAIAARRLREA
jgi:hypothetical protein